MGNNWKVLSEGIIPPELAEAVGKAVVLMAEHPELREIIFNYYTGEPGTVLDLMRIQKSLCVRIMQEPPPSDAAVEKAISDSWGKKRAQTNPFREKK